MPLEYESSKDKLPVGLSYPLKRSQIDPVMEAAGVARLACVEYRRRLRSSRPGDVVMEVIYYGDRTRIWWYEPGSSAIYVYAVPSDIRKAVAEALCGDTLPRIAAWIGGLERAGNTRRDPSHCLTARWDGAGLSLLENGRHD